MYLSVNPIGCGQSIFFWLNVSLFSFCEFFFCLFSPSNISERRHGAKRCCSRTERTVQSTRTKYQKISPHVFLMILVAVVRFRQMFLSSVSIFFPIVFDVIHDVMWTTSYSMTLCEITKKNGPTAFSPSFTMKMRCFFSKSSFYLQKHCISNWNLHSTEHHLVKWHTLSSGFDIEKLQVWCLLYDMASWSPFPVDNYQNFSINHESWSHY